MSYEENTQLPSANPSSSPTTHPSSRARVGLVIEARETAAAITAIADAEAAGVEQIWMTQTPQSLDTLTLFAAAATRTTHIRMGTSIVPTYPRHPAGSGLLAVRFWDHHRPAGALPGADQCCTRRSSPGFEHADGEQAHRRGEISGGALPFKVPGDRPSRPGRVYGLQAAIPTGPPQPATC